MRLVILFAVLLFPGPTLAMAAPIHDASKKGDVAAIAAALAEGADINATNKTETPLFYAVESGSRAAVELLIDRGANVNAYGKRGPPVFAAASCNPDLLSLLVSKGADPNAKVNSKTVLHMAAQGGDVRCVKLLVDAGANVNALTTERETAYHLARRNADPAAADYILQHGFKPPVAPPLDEEKLKAADVEAGKRAFIGYDCGGCHNSEAGQPVKIGPNLWGVVARPKASMPGFDYSPAMKAWGSTWNLQDLNAFIWGPRLTLPGTKMQFRGIEDDQKRMAVIAYLRSLSDTPPATGQ